MAQTFLSKEQFEEFSVKVTEAIIKKDLTPIIDEMTEFLNEKINIPILGEKTEGKLIKAFLESIIEVAIEGASKLTNKDGEETDA